MDKLTQRMKILNYCAEHGSITVREAFTHLGINSPTKRISELVKAGYDVQKEEVVKTNAEGKTVRFLRYFIKEAANSEA